ncbi:MAG TPA: hypothetical protein VND23_07135, partial [Acidimicrobiales bacterium]|nr:hypothetical protein [Acidimicrobiales bacterium]
VALTWRPRPIGAGLLAGALLPFVAQVISALAQPVPGPTYFGVGPGEAASAQLTIAGGFTAWFYVYCAFLAGCAALVPVLATRGGAAEPPLPRLRSGAAT